MSVGYANRVVHLDFSRQLAAPVLDADKKPVQEKDPLSGEPLLDAKGRPIHVPSERIWVSMRNPSLMTLDELTPKAVPLDENGQPVTALSANEAMFEIFAKLILGWRAYDATSFEIDPTTGEALPQPLLELPATVEQIRKLPKVIVDKIADQMMQAASPND
jgi:hypothetical protein